MTRLSRLPGWLTLSGLAALAALILALSPTEQTLGANVRIVYLHVSLTRAGEIGLVAAGLVGLALLVNPASRLGGWVAPISRVGLGFYAAGFAVSIIAEQVIWGGISFQEPRMIAALDVLAVAAIVQVLITWLPQTRARAALHVAMAAVIVWALVTAQNVLHPGAAIGSSGSTAIRLYSYALLAVCLLAAGWIAWSLRRPEPTPAQSPARA